MRGNSLLRALVVCGAARGPFSAILGDAILWSAWMDFASIYLSHTVAKFVLPCAFLCLSMGAQAQAAVTAAREGVFR